MPFGGIVVLMGALELDAVRGSVFKVSRAFCGASD